MKPHKLTYYILAAGIFILIFSTLAGASIVYKYNEINGPNGTNKVSVNLLDNADLQKNSGFTLDDIKHLQQFSYKNVDMAYAHEDIDTAAYEKNQTRANILGISDKYSMFHRVDLLSGSFITPGNKDEMVAVVDEDLANELFNNKNVIGMYIELYGQKFRIIGVMETDESIIHTLTGNGYGRIYIPAEQMLEYDDTSRITSLEVKASDKGTTGRNIGSMEEALASIDKNASDYKILDYNIELMLLNEKAQINTFICSAAIIIILLLSIIRRITDAYTIINSSLKENYFRNVLKPHYRKLVLATLEAIAASALIYLVWETVRFDAYIPAEYIPDDPTDLGFFTDLFKSLMQKRVQSTGYIPSYPEMKANVLDIMQNWNLYIGMLAGLPLYYLGLKLLEPEKENTVKRLLYCCVFILSSMALGLLILSMFSMPVMVDTKRILTIFAFVFLTVIGIEQISQKKHNKSFVELKKE
ncbi:MAG TPA: ABC transporter permease [Clostridia bacterium]|nr:ABC transporter permease [Clostridia bacterium]